MRRAWRRWRYRRLQRRLVVPRFIAAFAAAHEEVVFVEIGADDGEQHDHLRPHILAGGWRGVMVEPVPYVFERLRGNYAGVPGVALEQAAVGKADGSAPFFFLRDATAGERAGLPDWYDGVGSFSREAILSHAPQIPDVAERLVEREVPVVRFDTLLERHGIERPDLVVVDTEGHDWAILRTIDLERHGPRLLLYEHFHLSDGDRAAALEHLQAAGYETLEEGFDTLCLRPEGDALTRAFRRARPAVAGVSKQDELPLHDTSVGLPPGAEQELRTDHPRLLELRAAYAALDLPVLSGSRWTPERVEGFLDLRYFRGETLITWHYREAPEATERKYRALHEHVRARDELGLLDRLGEDGLFGCWTYDGVSRDLLDSVLELTYLERAIGLEGCRVLDVGAGYGRLAHRAAGAFAVADWCCIDAVPESTFLSEYYLRFRGAIPPARVVALPEHGSLGAFDVAVNVHSFSEMPLAAIEWWLTKLASLRIPELVIVPNDGEQLLSLEPDGARRGFASELEQRGYGLVECLPVHDDPAVPELLGVRDHFHRFRLA